MGGSAQAGAQDKAIRKLQRKRRRALMRRTIFQNIKHDLCA